MDKKYAATENTIGSADWVKELVQRVLYAIAFRQRQQDEYALAVFTGGTAGLLDALSGLETLMLNGLSMKIVLSDSASHLYGDVIDERLLPWPGAQIIEPTNWFQEVQKSTGIIVPMLSVNALSKACALMADSLAGNIILQGLFMGKPLVAAIDGAAPGSSDRRAIGLDQGSAGLQRAVAERLIQFSDLGGSLTWSYDLGTVGQRILLSSPEKPRQHFAPTSRADVFSNVEQIRRVSVVDAAMVRKANREGTSIQASAGAVLTPLAKELVQQYGTRITTY